MMKTLLFGLVFLAVASLRAGAEPTPAPKQELSPLPAPPAEDILKTLRKGHPRLLATEADFAALKKQAATSATLKRWAESLRADAEKLLKEPPRKYEIPDGKRLLATSRKVRDRVWMLALVYRLTGEKRFLDRAWAEMDAAAKFKDWNPSHFLDTAEMTSAFAIGYDWLYDAWSPEQRAVLKTAILEKGLQPAFAAYKKGEFWTTCAHNWNQVCHGGISMGALAIADEEPALSAGFLQRALKNVPLAMAEYAPDGAWPEGPGYWNYATSYNVYFLASLESALGNDFGLAKLPGFSQCGTFPIYGTGPTDMLFNFADASAKGTFHGAAELLWLASKFQNPSFAAFQLRYADKHPSTLDFLWGAAWVDRKPAMGTFPHARYYRGTELVSMRTAWDAPQATFVGFKAGRNAVNHSNLDLGSFVLDAQGVRWAADPGSDNYNMPGYFSTRTQRWTYYRMRAEAHNTLLINPGKGPDQNIHAATTITRFSEGPQRTFAIANLTDAYTPAAGKVQRGIALENGGEVLVQDEIQTAAPADVWWLLHTPAEIEIGNDGASAVLKRGAARLRVELRSSQAARFEVRAAAPLPTSPNPPGQGDNSDLRVLALHFENAQDLRIAVRMTPLTANASSLPASSKPLTPLAEWK